MKDYGETIVSMSDATERTGNANYKDCRIPSDEDLIAIADKYGFTTGLKITITSAVGNKTKFTADIVAGKLVRTSGVKQDLTTLKQICMKVREQELEHILKYKDIKDINKILKMADIGEEVIWGIVTKKREGLWFGIPDSYAQAMYNCVAAEYLTSLL